MASPASSFSGHYSPTSPFTTRPHGRIAKIIYEDGYTDEQPLIESLTSSSPLTVGSPDVFSRSTSHRRGRKRGESFGTDASATGSTRELLSGLNVGSSKPLEIPTNAEAVLSPQQPPWSPDVTASGTSVRRDHVQFGEDWSAMTIDRGESQNYAFGQDTWMDESQDQLVSNANGAGQDVFSIDDLDMTGAFNDITNQQHEPVPAQFQLPSPSYANYDVQNGRGSASAPAATSYMHHARRSTLHGVVDDPLEEEHIAELVTTASNRPTKKPGRAKGSRLPDDKRKKAHAMRIMGACDYCKSGRRGCDPGMPCRPCISHFGPDLLNDAHRCRRPCRSLPLVEDLSKQILEVRWHPHPRQLSHFFGRDVYVTEWRFDIPISFPFGPPLQRSIQVIKTSDNQLLRHQHVNYALAPVGGGSSPVTSVDYVLPVTFSRHDDLLSTVDDHLTTLVKYHFPSFALPSSDLQILDKIYKLYIHHQQSNHDYAVLIEQALKLLLLPYMSRPSVSKHSQIIDMILFRYAPGYCPSQNVTPCLLRAELAAVLPQVASLLLRDVLTKVLKITLAKRCETHPIVLTVFSVLMMVIESTSHASSLLGYHAHTRLPTSSAPISASFNTSFSTSLTTSFNASFNTSFSTTSPTQSTTSNTTPFQSTASTLESSPGLATNAAAASQLIRLYRYCFEDCHRSVILVDPTKPTRPHINSGTKPRARAGSTGTLLTKDNAGRSVIGDKAFADLQRKVGDCAARFLAQVGGEVAGRRAWLENKAGEGEKSEDDEVIEGKEKEEGVVFDRYLARLLVLWDGGEGDA